MKTTLYQTLGFAISILSSMVLVAGLEPTKYGELVYMIALIDLVYALMLLGFDVAILKLKKTIEADRLEAAVQASRFIVFLLIGLGSVLYATDTRLEISIYLVCVAALINIGYQYYAENNLAFVSKCYFISRLMYCISIISIIAMNVMQEYFILIAYSFSYVLNSVLLAIGKGIQIADFRLLKKTKINDVLDIIKYSATRIWVILELYIVLLVGKNWLSPSEFGVFAVCFTISKLINGVASIEISKCYFKDAGIEVGAAAKQIIVIVLIALLILVTSVTINTFYSNSLSISILKYSWNNILDIILGALLVGYGMITANWFSNMFCLANDGVVAFFQARVTLLVCIYTLAKFFEIDSSYGFAVIYLISESLSMFLTWSAMVRIKKLKKLECKS